MSFGIQNEVPSHAEFCLHKNPQPKEKSTNIPPTTDTMVQWLLPAHVVIRNHCLYSRNSAPDSLASAKGRASSQSPSNNWKRFWIKVFAKGELPYGTKWFFKSLGACLRIGALLWQLELQPFNQHPLLCNPHYLEMPTRQGKSGLLNTWLDTRAVPLHPQGQPGKPSFQEPPRAGRPDGKFCTLWPTALSYFGTKMYIKKFKKYIWFVFLNIKHG